ncbi:MAG TPA: hypothetical protein PK142_02935 [bacterium]|nr:hypothetical protein [bacterium]
MLSYRTVLKQAWKISWKNKILWFFGFFASLISFSAEFKVISRSLNQEMGLQTLNNLKLFLNTGIFSKDSWLNFIELIKNDPKSILFLVLVLILIAGVSIFFAWLSTVSQISIINSVKNIINEKKEKITIKNSIKNSNKSFWPVFLMNIVISLAINIIYLIISFLFVLVIIKNQATATILYGLVFIIFIAISLFLSFIIKYGIAYVVIEKEKFFLAIKRGWSLFFNNWLISIEMAIVLFFINLLAIILVSFLSFIAFFLFFGLALSTTLIASPAIIFWTILIIGILVVLAIMALGGAILNTFQTSSWTDLFIKIKDEKKEAKLERIFKK